MDRLQDRAYSIPVFLLKILSGHISIPLCDIINDSFLGMMKLAKFLSLYKKNSPEDLSNYRPTSLLPVFSKVIEKLMFTRLYDSLEKHDVLYSLQFGFRSKHSTLHALISLTKSMNYCSGIYHCGLSIGFKLNIKQQVLL